MVNIQEPPIDPKHDTQPTGTHRAVNINEQQGTSVASRILGGLMLLGALGFTLAAIGVLTWPSLNPDDEAPVVMSVTNVPSGNVTEEPTDEPTLIPTIDFANMVHNDNHEHLPTLDPETANALLTTTTGDICLHR